MKNGNRRSDPALVLSSGLTVLLMGALVSCSGKPTSGDATSTNIPARREFPVNPAISPCQNFYEYACSKVNASFKLPADRSYHDFAFQDASERLLAAKKKFLALLPTEKHLSPRGEILKTTYLACMNKKASAAEERALVQSHLKRIRALRTRVQFENFIGSRVLSKDVGWIQFYTIANLKDPRKNDAFIVAKTMTLPERSYYQNPKVVAEFTKVVTDFFKTIGENHPKLRARQVVAFEKAFAEKYPLPAQIQERFSSDKFQFTKAQFQTAYPHIRLQALLNKIPNTTVIRNLAPEASEYLDHALATTPLTVLKDVYLFEELRRFMDDGYSKFHRKVFAFDHRVLGGPAVRPPRNERCTQKVMNAFEMELDHELLPKLFPHFSKLKFVSFAEKVRHAIIKGLKKNNWLSAVGKKRAIYKIEHMRLQLIEPTTTAEWNFTPPAIYSVDHPYGNWRSLRLNTTLRELARLKKPRNPLIWEMGPLEVEAYYSFSDNKFVVPLGILEYPFYDAKLPDYVNFGGIGMVMGHEMGHGIDNSGSQFDYLGRRHPWLPKRDTQEFNKHTAELVTQFDQAGINGKLTLGENIGDLTGLTFAFHAAFPHPNPPEKQVRAFFTQYARLWCTVERPKYRELQLKINPHSPPDARTNQQVRLQPAFAKAFSCKPGDPMTLPASKRVVVW